jgi:hypothetical protein
MGQAVLGRRDLVSDLLAVSTFDHVWVKQSCISFIILTLGANVIKISLLLTNLLNKLECFPPGRPFQPSLLFSGKAWSLPKRGATKRRSTWADSGLSHKNWIRL